uniref:EF-hand domain-containing protein n=1 Tax=Spongospora subterranea TaxID=70186 RepID=A0A0H5QUT7_9EUKA|eukprot:CRZ05522.1 hypothetical protein [Spongospora subterranea]
MSVVQNGNQKAAINGTATDIRRPFFADAEIRQAFLTLDVDGNGFVSSTELRVVLDACGKIVTDEEIDQMMKVVDTDGDGQLSFQEFIVMVKRDIMGLTIQQSDIQVEVANKTEEAPKLSSIDKMKNRIKKQGEVFEFVSSLALDISQLEDIYFQKIQRLPKRTIQYSQFCNIFRCPESRSSERVFTVYENDKDDEVDARILVMALSAVLPINQLKKAKFSFRLFDPDQTGCIHRDAVIDILKANHLANSADEVEKKADLIVSAAASADNPDNITFDSFVEVIKRFPNIVFPAFKLQQ